MGIITGLRSAGGLGLGGDSAGNLAEAVAILAECGAVRMAGKSIAPTAGAGNDGSRDPAAPAANGPALPPTDGKVGVEVQQDVGVDVRGGGGAAGVVVMTMQALPRQCLLPSCFTMINQL